MRKVRITYFHPMKPAVELETAGVLPEELNGDDTSSYFVKRHDGMVIDVPKDKVIEVFELS
tara:strand:- start:7671 stop:7853 length:183 start_codon:yes stop_codon:yes gene_type:complete